MWIVLAQPLVVTVSHVDCRTYDEGDANDEPDVKELDDEKEESDEEKLERGSLLVQISRPGQDVHVLSEEELRDRIGEELDLLQHFDEDYEYPETVEESEDDVALATDRTVIHFAVTIARVLTQATPAEFVPAHRALHMLTPCVLLNVVATFRIRTRLC